MFTQLTIDQAEGQRLQREGQETVAKKPKRPIRREGWARPKKAKVA